MADAILVQSPATVNLAVIAEKGDKGNPGNDGYTPVKGVDYFDGEQGPQGIPGVTPDIAVELNTATEQTVINNTDVIPIIESTTLKKTLWSTIKSTLKTYFDGLYLALTGGTITGTTFVDISGSADYTVGLQVKISAATHHPILQYLLSDNSVLFYVRYDGTNHHHYFNKNVYYNMGSKSFYFNGTNSVAVIGGAYFRADPLIDGSTAGLQISMSGYATALIPLTKSVIANMRTFAWDGSNGSTIVSQSNIRQIQQSALANDARISIGLSLTPYTEHFIINLLNGRIGIGTTAPDKQLEINSADGNCLRLTYNDANGSATYYADLLVSAAGLTINTSGGIINTANDIEITDATKGIILTSPDASRWRITVGNDGVLTTTKL